MAIYAVGDLQGCALRLEELLDRIGFDPDTDRLWLTGDLVNRGPQSVEALRLVRRLGNSAITVLGNHDLHLLAMAEGVKQPRRGDTMIEVLQAPDREELLHWLRHQPLIHCDRELRTLMVHAGIYPGWSRKQALGYAAELEAHLQGDDYRTYLKQMYGRHPLDWDEGLGKWKRARFITNVFTRMRYCDRRGFLNFNRKGAPGSQPRRLMPWFRHPRMKCRKWTIVFGHWSSLGFHRENNVVCLDSGCVWGSALTAIRLDGGTAGRYWQLSCRRQGPG